MPAAGHLFVVHADMRQPAADAYVIPCDRAPNVTGQWRPLVEPGMSAQKQWFVPQDARHVSEYLFRLPDAHTQESLPDSVVGPRFLLDTVSGARSPLDLAKRALGAVEYAARAASTHLGRHLPLVALPMLGVGAGNFFYASGPQWCGRS